MKLRGTEKGEQEERMETKKTQEARLKMAKALRKLLLRLL